mmetsp:Transcript_46111/g.68692  ORF Transcript_46111/g.68692 Transcript_46111/m.68692 type:complete len:145 (-) Transcript_46111:51-485(-)
MSSNAASPSTIARKVRPLNRGLRLEAWKFGVYLMIPIGASWYFNAPDRQTYWADYFEFIKQPPSPNTNLKQQFEDLQKQRESQKEQRKEYLEQLAKLQASAKKSREAARKFQEEEEEASKKKKGWLSRWFGRRRRQEDDSATAS